jgi:hypothetical protein
MVLGFYAAAILTSIPAAYARGILLIVGVCVAVYFLDSMGGRA